MIKNLLFLKTLSLKKLFKKIFQLSFFKVEYTEKSVDSEIDILILKISLFLTLLNTGLSFLIYQ